MPQEYVWRLVQYKVCCNFASIRSLQARTRAVDEEKVSALSKELDSAIHRGDLASVKRLLDLDQIDVMDDEFTALHWAAICGKAEVVKHLVESGANIDIVSLGYDRDALMYAVASKSVECVQLLLSHGANPNHQTKIPSSNPETGGGHTALMQASGSGSLVICQILLDAGAQAATQSESGWTALFWAVYRYKPSTNNSQHLEVIRLLVEHGSDPNLKSKEGISALDEALEMEFTDVVALLQSY